jgi:hypothetical protein
LPVELSWNPLVVGIKECDVLAAGGREASVTGGTHTAIGVVCKISDAGIRNSLDQCLCPVATSVIDDQHLDVVDSLSEAAVDGAADGIGPVVRRDDDTDTGFLRRWFS